MDTSGWHKLKDTLTSFRGYKVWKRSGGKQDEIAAGDHARGTLHAWNDRGGVVAHIKNFWQQFPKAAEVGADGTVRLGLWPREWKWPHMLQDGSAKGHEIVLHFYATKDAAGRPQPKAVADLWDARVFALPSLEHRAATGALSDMGPYTPPTRGPGRPDTRMAANCPKSSPTTNSMATPTGGGSSVSAGAPTAGTARSARVSPSMKTTIFTAGI